MFMSGEGYCNFKVLVNYWQLSQVPSVASGILETLDKKIRKLQFFSLNFPPGYLTVSSKTVNYRSKYKNIYCSEELFM